MPPPAEGFATRLILGPALRTQPDRRLVTLVREGYEAAFEEIVRRYGKPLTRYAAAIVGGRGEDVTQDAFSKALLALRRDGAEIELRPWLFRIVRNTALNELRDSPPAAEELAEAIAGGRSPAEELERREELTDLMRRLQSLPEPQRAAIVMRELEGLSHEEIAAALGLSGGGARQAIYRARQALRDGLGMLLPLPLLRLLIDHGGDVATIGASGATAAATGGAVGGAGAGMALKAGVVTAVLAGSVGAGIAAHDRGHGDADAATGTAMRVTARPDVTTPAEAEILTSEPSRGAEGEGHGDGGSGRSGPDQGDGGPGTSSGGGGPDEVSAGVAFAPSGGPGPSASSGEHHGGRGSGDGGHAGERDHLRGDGRDEGDGESHSGPGPSGGRSGEEHSGHGRGGPEGSEGGSRHGDGGQRGSGDAGDEGSGSEELSPPPPPAEELRDDDGSGSGSGNSDSGGSDSGSGGSGSSGRGGDELP